VRMAAFRSRDEHARIEKRLHGLKS
jgi:hypothetical protein